MDVIKLSVEEVATASEDLVDSMVVVVEVVISSVEVTVGSLDVGWELVTANEYVIIHIVNSMLSI